MFYCRGCLVNPPFEPYPTSPGPRVPSLAAVGSRSSLKSAKLWVICDLDEILHIGSKVNHPNLLRWTKIVLNGWLVQILLISLLKSYHKNRKWTNAENREFLKCKTVKTAPVIPDFLHFFVISSTAAILVTSFQSWEMHDAFQKI